MTAKRDIPCRRRQVVKTTLQFKPLAVVVNEAHDRNRYIAQARGEFGHDVKGIFGERVEDLVTAQRVESCTVIFRFRRGNHTASPLGMTSARVKRVNEVSVKEAGH
jgi:hypothetical protein